MTGNPNSISIRDGVTPDDIELCADIWVRAIEFRDGTVDAQEMAQRVRSAFDNPIVRFAVATAPRSGFALVDAGRSDPAEALLHYLAVDPDGVGSGVGTALLDDAVEQARLRGFERVTLEVRTTNARALALYTRKGFAPFGEEIPHAVTGLPMRSYRLALSR